MPWIKDSKYKQWLIERVQMRQQRDELLDVAERISKADLRQLGHSPLDQKHWAEVDALLVSVIYSVRKQKEATNA